MVFSVKPMKFGSRKCSRENGGNEKVEMLLQSTIESDSVRLKECRKVLDDSSREHRRLNRILNRRRKTHVSALESLKNALKGLDGDNDALRNGLNEILADCSGAIVGI